MHYWFQYKLCDSSLSWLQLCEKCNARGTHGTYLMRTAVGLSTCPGYPRLAPCFLCVLCASATSVINLPAARRTGVRLRAAAAEIACRRCQHSMPPLAIYAAGRLKVDNKQTAPIRRSPHRLCVPHAQSAASFSRRQACFPRHPARMSVPCQANPPRPRFSTRFAACTCWARQTRRASA